MSDLIGGKSILHKIINFLGQEVQQICCNHFSEKNYDIYFLLLIIYKN